MCAAGHAVPRVRSAARAGGDHPTSRSFPHAHRPWLHPSDYPHWDFDEPRVVQPPAAWREAVMSGNARALYGLDVRDETSARAA